jgi:predicted secreted protein
MPGKKTHAFGTKFNWDGKQVASINNIGGVEFNVDTVDVTTHDSEGAFKEFIAGLLDAGDVPISGFFDHTDTDGQLAMVADCASRLIKPATIVFPASTGTQWAFNGLITNIKVGDAPTDDGIPFSATIKISGKPILTVTTAAGLTNLAVTGATLVPAFSAAVKGYIATASAATETITVTPTAAGIIKVNGTVVTSGSASGNIALGEAGSITSIIIEVTEENKAPKVYTISVARAAV